MTTLLMHGSYSAPSHGWFRWLESELIMLGRDVIIEKFPGEDWQAVTKAAEQDPAGYRPAQSLESWEAFFVESVLPRIQGDEIDIVLHSLAPVFMLHMFEKYEFLVRTAVFVSPFFDLGKTVWQFDLVNGTFYRSEFDFARIRSRIGASFVLYGDNDPFVKPEQPRSFARELGSSVIAVHGGGHCMDDKFKTFPLVLDLLKVSGEGMSR